MALLLGALIIHGITPGPRLIVEHPDIFWGLIASFWIGNIILIVLNVPLIGLWVKMLTVPYKFLFPSALFFICIGVYADRNSLFDVGVTLFFGVFGYLLMLLKFEPAPILLGFVLGPRFEETFRRAMIISRGDLFTFQERWISGMFLSLCVLLVGGQIYVRLRSKSPLGSGVAAIGTLLIVGWFNIYVAGLCLLVLGAQFLTGTRSKEPVAGGPVASEPTPTRVAGE